MIPTTDFVLARQNMIDGQIRPNKVTDSALLQALAQVPREAFLPYDLSNIAYMDEAVEVAPGRALLPPTIFARLIQALRIAPGDQVLVIGGLTGYSAAILSHIGADVVMIEQDPALVELAKRHADKSGAGKIDIISAALSANLAEGRSFSKILVEGAVAEIPEGWNKLLAAGGAMAVVEMPDRKVGRAMLVTATGKTPLFDTNVPYLTGFEPKPVFSF